MNDRILDLTLDAGRLHVDQGRVVFDCDKERLFAIPAQDLGVVLISSRNLTVTPSVFGVLADAGVSVVVCDRAYKPQVMMLPLEVHHLQSERLRLQIEASKPRRKQLWKQIVQAKIRAQANALEDTGQDGGRLVNMAQRVRSGDPENVEAQASRWYWQRIFADSSFRRRQDGDGENLLLNYGYAILRGAVARAVCASGLHPSIGIHHHNRYNPFCLVDDLIEPFRPIVDLIVVSLRGEQVAPGELTPELKRNLVAELTCQRSVHGERRKLFDYLMLMTNSLVESLRGKAARLVFPDFR